MIAKKALEAKIAGWSRTISLIGLVGLLILALITVLEALSRSWFGFPIPGVGDISSLVITVAICACFPLVFAERGNITVRFVVDALGPRGKAVLECFGTLMSMAVFCLLAWQLWIYSNELVESNATTWIILWPTAPWWYVATFLVCLCIPVQLTLFFLDIKQVFTGREESGNEPEESQKGGQI